MTQRTAAHWNYRAPVDVTVARPKRRGGMLIFKILVAIVVISWVSTAIKSCATSREVSRKEDVSSLEFQRPGALISTLEVPTHGWVRTEMGGPKSIGGKGFRWESVGNEHRSCSYRVNGSGTERLWTEGQQPDIGNGCYYLEFGNASAPMTILVFRK